MRKVRAHAFRVSTPMKGQLEQLTLMPIGLLPYIVASIMGWTGTLPWAALVSTGGPAHTWKGVSFFHCGRRDASRPACHSHMQSC